MAPTPQLSFEQALALLHHRHSTSPTQSSPSSSRRQIPQSHSSFQDALAMLHSGEYLHHSRDFSQRSPAPSHSHSEVPSTHRENVTTTRASGFSRPPPSQITSGVQSGRTSSSTSIQAPRFPQVQRSAPIYPFRQALAMLQRGEHRTVTTPHVTSHQQSMPSVRQETTAPSDRHAIMRGELMLVNTNLELRAILQEALARLHRLEHQSHEAEAQVHDGRNPLHGAISRHSQETHSATQQVRSSNNQVNARMTEANAAGRLVRHVDVSSNLMGGHRQHSTEAHSSITLANLPSLSFDEACDAITWRSVRKLEILNCGICLDDFDAKHEVHLFPNCNHLFHVECVKDWLLKAGSCPCCRIVIINVEDRAEQ